MSRRSWYLLVVLAFALHNIEEGIGASRMLEQMRSRAPAFLRAFYAGIEVSEFRTSLVILTILAVVVAMLAARIPDRSTSAYVMLVFAAFIGLNALAHFALTFVFREYMPGVVTAVCLTLPIAIFILVRARREGWVSSAAFWTVLPAAALVHGPVLAGFLSLAQRFSRSL